MKKILTLVFVLTIALTSTACTKIDTTTSTDSKGKTIEGKVDEGKIENKKDLTLEEAKEKADSFVNEYLTQGVAAILKDISEEGGMYKTVFEFQGQEIISYLSKDGTKFFPQVMDIEETIKQKEVEIEASKPVKQEKANVELFVMSHCPYGTQIEKGIIPVLETLGDKVDFTLKFCDYIMHGEVEANEQVKEYCIQKNEPDKIVGYLKCFLADENSSDKCVSELGIDTNNLNSCIEEANTKYNIAENLQDTSRQFPAFDIFKEDNQKYSVQGSPTLIINGKTSNAGRDSAALLKAICDGYINPPEECNTELSSSPPAPGFGYGEATGQVSTDASCG